MSSCLLLRSSRTFSSSHSLRNVSTLVFLEHKGGKINSATLSALTLAKALGGSVTGIIAGCPKSGELAKSIDEAKKLQLSKLLVKEHESLDHALAEPLAPLIASVTKERSFSHLVGGTSSVTKNIFPRISALLDVSQISDVMKVVDPETFVRPIYAGNALCTLKSKDPIKVITVRTASFEPIASSSGTEVEVEKLESASPGPLISKWNSESLTKSERPELGSASRIVSGGRGVKNKENFDKILIPLSDKLNSAIGASRAAVDSGFADNSLQVGQTGKVVSPDLYIAIGISGAIQHLAGMKDSKTIVAINKDPEAPIFQVADIGLVADLFEAVP
ncbi:hypothetical protein CROQUDRAFT_43674 [Cronartium quercuum f. sp. fusiforme G11]|uniref:Probable electron transfer flavoprotein subunit alpha n=1 Tax=Cronartium quercuum f. sp. fusiforme G11 TaxID=708437 RepID=A0A9P6NMN4_9BASI|nr:hypothetical protein CROQUDRAFT_43674 [Cronartium quercuum f. sp. fusiforme G11]